jgi:hypothetical protein
MTFTSYTENFLPVNILDCTLATGSVPAVTITANAGGGTVAIGDMVVRCATGSPGKACYYTSSTASGSASNAGRSVAYGTVGVTAVTTGFTDAIVPLNCGGSGTFGVTLTNLVQGTGTNPVTITQS